MAPGRHRVVMTRNGYQEVDQNVMLIDGVTRGLTIHWRIDDSHNGNGFGGRPRPVGKRPLPGFNLDFDSSAVSGFTSGYGRQVVHWAFDGDLQDSSGQLHPAKAVGRPEFTHGRTGQAVSLTAGSVVNTDDALVECSSELSIVFWIKGRNWPQADLPILDGEEVQLSLPGGSPKLLIGGVGPAPGRMTDQRSGGFLGIDLNRHVSQWSHLCVVYSKPAGQVHFYLNGEHVGFQWYQDPPPAVVGKLVLGNLDAEIDDLRMFDYRLSTTDVQRLLAGEFKPYRDAPTEPNGQIVRETWLNVPLAAQRRQAESMMTCEPDQVAAVTTEIAFVDVRVDSERLHRVRGFLYPPVDGEYIFLLMGTGEISFFLQQTSPEEDTLKQVLATGIRRRAESEPVLLDSDRPYYFELLQCSRPGPAQMLRLGARMPGMGPPRPAIPAEFAASYEQTPERAD